MARKYNIIYADPPWSYNRKIGRGIAETQYQTMSIDEIGSIPVNKITADDAMLFLWVTFPQLKEGLSVIESWGFKYKTCAFNWIKQNPKSDSFFVGLGFWTRSCSEICLLSHLPEYSLFQQGTSSDICLRQPLLLSACHISTEDRHR